MSFPGKGEQPITVPFEAAALTESQAFNPSAFCPQQGDCAPLLPCKMMMMTVSVLQPSAVNSYKVFLKLPTGQHWGNTPWVFPGA